MARCCSSAAPKTLTAAGRLFKPYCERILKEIESSELAISELEGLMRGTLRMAVFHSFSHSMLPPILSEFALRYPGVHVTARLVPRFDMERDLLNAELDMAVAYISDDNDQIVADRLFDEELVLVVGSRHPHAGRKSMPMRELAKPPLVLLTPEFGARQFVDRFFADINVRPHVVLEMNAIEPILATIRDSGLAVSCRPVPSWTPPVCRLCASPIRRRNARLAFFGGATAIVRPRRCAWRR